LYLIESHIIKNNNNLNDICVKTKNLYNKANYIIRQEFINHGNYITVYDMYTIMKDHVEYKDLLSRIARPTLRILNANWKSFFNAMKEWKKNPNRFTGKPNLPKYLPKNSKFTAILVDNAVKTKNLEKEGYIELYKTGIKLPFQNKSKKIIEVQVKPLKTKKYKINIVYKYDEKPLKLDNSKYCSVDLGVNNLMAITSNEKVVKPIIINGRPLKSINQYYNKKLSKLQSKLPKKTFISKRLYLLTEKRNNKINNYLHNASKYLVDFCLKNDLNTIIIGYNKSWKQNVNMGKKNNQNFVQIPFYKLIQMIEYKALKEGLNVKLNEESFTSKCSFIDGEELKKHKEYCGKRVSRGMFKSKENILINADLNASYNILKKVVPEFKWDRGCAVHPELITIGSN